MSAEEDMEKAFAKTSEEEEDHFVNMSEEEIKEAFIKISEVQRREKALNNMIAHIKSKQTLITIKNESDKPLEISFDHHKNRFAAKFFRCFTKPHIVEREETLCRIFDRKVRVVFRWATIGTQMTNLLEKGSTFIVTSDGQYTKGNTSTEDYEEHIEKPFREKCERLRTYCKYNHKLYEVVGLKSNDKDKITKEMVLKAYETRRAKKKSRYTPSEIEAAFVVLHDDIKRKNYNEFLELTEKSCWQKIKRWLKNRWHNFWPFGADKTWEEKKLCWARIGCLLVTGGLAATAIAISGGYILIPIGILKFMALFACGGAATFGFARVLSDTFTPEKWLISTIGGAVVGAGTGAICFGANAAFIGLGSLAGWLQQALATSLTEASAGVFISMFSDFEAKFVDKIEGDYSFKAVVTRAAISGFFGSILGFAGGALANVAGWLPNYILDDTVEQSVGVIFRKYCIQGAIKLLKRLSECSLVALSRGVPRFYKEIKEYGIDEVDVAQNAIDCAKDMAIGAVCEIGVALGKGTWKGAIRKQPFSAPKFEIDYKPKQNGLDK